MSRILLEEKTNELLRKFGAGDHKPGSGSAAAYLGLLSAQLLRTVIELTDDPKRYATYSKYLPELRKIREEIDTKILPELEELFQTDSDKFHIAIQAREDRNSETDIYKKNELVILAREELKPATIIPIKIAELCIKISEYSGYVYDHGFKSARGDTGVAQHAAIGAVGGCLSIIYLNLLSLPADSWTENVRSKLFPIREKYQKLMAVAIDYVEVLKIEADKHYQCQSDLNNLIARIPKETELTDTLIEGIARELQLLLWKHKDTIWKYEEINDDDPLIILKPDTALKKIGYQFYKLPYIEQNTIDGELFDVAGIIDKEHKFVQVSKDFSLETQKFTTAHELGHALLHNHSVLHRDRPIDGSSSSQVRDYKEKQADMFAACFLMPEKQIKKIFKEIFDVDKFVVNEDNVFNLTQKSLKEFREIHKDKREVSRFLAEPLAHMFEVSLETMAIRLEELDLVDYNMPK